MQIHCPQCHIAIDNVVPSEEIVCPSCGSSLQLDLERTKSWIPTKGPRRIDRFELLEELGVGAFGYVFKARDTKLDRTVAIKIPRAGNLTTKEDIDRFLREARSAAQLQHSGIVSVHDAGQDGDTCWLVSEYIQGETLSDRIQRTQFAFSEAAKLVATVADAVHFAHQRGVIHRDLKPSNIMLDMKGQPHVMDFGLAKRDAGEMTMTIDGQVLGTPAYMSPEQAQGQSHSTDARSDVYSLGVVLYVLLTGSLPFSGNKRMLMVQVIQDEPRPPRRLNDHIPRDLETITLKCMSKEPGQRYASAQDLSDDLRRHLRDEPITARRIGNLERLRRWSKRNPKVATLSATVLLLLVAIAGGTSVASVVIDRQRQDAVKLAGQNRQLVEDERKANDALREANKRAREAQRKAGEEAAIAEAVNDFLTITLANTSARQQQWLSGGRTEGRVNRDIKLRTVLDGAARVIGNTQWEQPLVEAAIRQTIGGTYLDLGEYEKSVVHLERALALRRKHLGTEHADTLTSQQSFAALHLKWGNYVEAEAMLKQTLDARRRILGEGHPDTLHCQQLLAGLCYAMGRHGEAELRYKQMLETQHRVLGGEDPQTLNSQANLAWLYAQRGRYDQAESLFKRLVETQRRVSGEAGFETLSRQQGLAWVYLALGRFDDAETLFKQTLETQRRVLGEEHPETLRCLIYLADVYSQRGRHGQAEILYKQLLEASRRVLGKDHPLTLSGQRSLAILYRQQGRVDESETLYKQTLEAQHRVLGPEHPDLLACQHSLAGLFLKEGRNDEAETLLTRTLEARRRVLGEEHSYTLDTQESLASLYSKRGRDDEAEALYKKTLETQRRMFGKEYPDTLSTQKSLGMLYSRLGRHDEAEALYKNTLETQRRVLGVKHLSTLGSLDLLAALYEESERYEEAEILRVQHLEIIGEILPGSPRYASSLSRLTLLLLKQSEFAEAEKRAQEHLTLCNKIWPNQWPLFRAESLLGNALTGQKKFEQAEPLLVHGYEAMKQGKIPPNQISHLTQAAGRLVDLYEAWDNPDEAKRWRKELQRCEMKERLSDAIAAAYDGRHSDALLISDQVQDREPENAELLLLLFNARIKLAELSAVGEHAPGDEQADLAEQHLRNAEKALLWLLKLPVRNRGDLLISLIHDDKFANLRERKGVRDVLETATADQPIERLVLLWIIERGDFIEVESEGEDKWKRVTTEQELMDSEDLQVRKVTLNNRNHNIDDEGVRRIAMLADLAAVEFAGTKNVTVDGLHHLERLPNVKDIRFNVSSIDDNALEIIGKLEQLEQLMLWACPIRGSGFKYLSNLKQLRWLSLGQSKLDGQNLVLLNELTGLEDLNLFQTGITDKDLTALEGMKLIELRLGRTKISDAGLETVATLGDLRRLRLDGTTVSDNGLETLTALPSLETLNLASTQITDAGIKHLQELKNLKLLDLSNTKVTKTGTDRLKKLLPGCRIKWRPKNSP